jgi:hypothetical protein
MRKTPDETGKLRVWMLPENIINESVKAYNTGATLTGYGTLGAPSGQYIAPASSPACVETISASYGDCGMRTLVVTGPMVWRFDMSFGKKVPITNRVNFEFRAEVYNVFNTVNFTPLTGVGGTTASDYEVTGARDEQRTTQLIFRLNF